MASPPGKHPQLQGCRAKPEDNPACQSHRLVPALLSPSPQRSLADIQEPWPGSLRKLRDDWRHVRGGDIRRNELFGNKLQPTTGGCPFGPVRSLVGTPRRGAVANRSCPGRFGWDIFKGLTGRLAARLRGVGGVESPSPGGTWQDRYPRSGNQRRQEVIQSMPGPARLLAADAERWDCGRFKNRLLCSVVVCDLGGWNRSGARITGPTG